MNDQTKPDLLLRSQQYELAEDAGTNPTANPTMGEIIASRLSRRDIMRGALAVTAANAAIVPRALETARAQTAAPAPAQTGSTTPSFNFREIAAGITWPKAMMPTS